MDETTKSRRVWGPLEFSILTGSGIDIGCGPDPVTPDVRRFDIKDGDANDITKYVHEQFDFVYSSHCLEHMRKPREALTGWWKLVKVGGHLFFTVPDEDLYEQGVFPSRFNHDHKATFTIFKAESWSPVSINVRDLAASLPNARLISLVLQDHGYDRTIIAPKPSVSSRVSQILLRVYRSIKFRTGVRMPSLEQFLLRRLPVDQTLRPDVLAQIQCIVQKVA
jgi:SAM-dependent methyltransferase